MANPEAEPKEPFRLRSLAFSVYLPTIFFSIGQGAAIPAIPLFARELGASLALAAFIVALRGIGQIIGDVPAGLAVSKWGDKGAMVAGTTLIGIVAIGASLSPTPLNARRVGARHGCWLGVLADRPTRLRQRGRSARAARPRPLHDRRHEPHR